jgi:hypothetical protein
VSQLGLARTDLKRMALSASVQTNLMPRMLGSAMFRAGLQYLLVTLNNARAKYFPFIFATTDVVLIEATNNTLRFVYPDATGMPGEILTRPSVTTAITNGTFSGSLSGWTNNDGGGCVSEWIAGNFMQLTGNGVNAADEYQAVALGGGDAGIEHAVRLVVALGVITLNIGTAHGDGTYARNLSLGPGTHSIAFTPAGTFYVDISNATQTRALVQSVSIDPAGALTLPTPWPLSSLQTLRWFQSADVVYVANGGIPQQKIIRWGQLGENGYHSWSIALYQPSDGPFGLENITAITMAVSGLSGNVALTASANYFQPGHVGALFRLASQGGTDATINAAGADQWSSAVEITGVGTQRYFTVRVTGTWSGTVVLQQSVGAIGAWTDVGTVTPGTSGIPTNANWSGVGNVSLWGGNIYGNVYDGLDNQIIFYRIGFESSYASGTAVCTLAAVGGSITGIVRINAVGSPTSATADVLIQPNNTGTLSGMGNTSPTNQWWEGIWSGVQGFPSAVGYFQGKLWWHGNNWSAGSVSDAYESYDDTVTGASAPIIQQIGFGPVDTIEWCLGLADMLIGSPGAELVIRSGELSGVVSATDFAIKPCSTQGSAPCPAVQIDFDAIFLQRSGRRLYMLTYSPNFFLVDYKATDLTNFVPDIAIMENGVPLSAGGFYWIAVQRQPDTRIHALLNDGTTRVMVFDSAEDEHAWIKVQMGASLAGAAVIEDMVVLPGQGGASSAEDLVYYVVRRTVNGQTLRSLERWAREDECIGQALSKCVDCHVSGTNGYPTATIGGLSHLIGERVVCWADGIDQGGPFTVSGAGTITLPVAVTNYCAGLAYTWQFQSTKLAYAAQLRTALLQKKRVARIGVLTANMAYQALQYGRDFAHLQDLPSVYKGAVVAPGTVFTAWDDETFAFDGAWDTDSRVCLQGQSPRPVIVLGIVIDMELRERS